jgi:hypothetical protein
LVSPLQEGQVYFADRLAGKNDQHSRCGMKQTKGYYSTFIVRIWNDETEGTMRGHIQHVSTQEHAYFLSLENMTDFIESHIGILPNDRTISSDPQGVIEVSSGQNGDVEPDG